MQDGIKSQLLKIARETIPAGWRRWRDAAETFREPSGEKLPRSRSTSRGTLDLNILDDDLRRWRSWYGHRGYLVIGSLVTIARVPKQANVEIYLESDEGKLYKRTEVLSFDRLGKMSDEIQNELNANNVVKLEQVFDENDGD
jgi:hypothetical protein